MLLARSRRVIIVFKLVVVMCIGCGNVFITVGSTILIDALVLWIPLLPMPITTGADGGPQITLGSIRARIASMKGDVVKIWFEYDGSRIVELSGGKVFLGCLGVTTRRWTIRPSCVFNFGHGKEYLRPRLRIDIGGVAEFISSLRLEQELMVLRLQNTLRVPMRSSRLNSTIFLPSSICDNDDLSRFDNQSIERDHLIGIGFVLDFVEFILFTFSDKEMILVIEACRCLGVNFWDEVFMSSVFAGLGLGCRSVEVLYPVREMIKLRLCDCEALLSGTKSLELVGFVFLSFVYDYVVVTGDEFEISSWRGARVGVRTYLLGGVIDGSEANGIIRDPKLELESSHFTFDLVPFSYESVDIVVGENWLLRHKVRVRENGTKEDRGVPKELVGFTPRRRMGFRMELVQGATPICEGSCRLTSLERQEVWNDCRSCKVRVGSNGNFLWEASVLLGRKKGG
ncbi:hypothetical protein Tco_1124575 [Tanacetum coccineum]|uniref:Uncharacterized protein n=1 Tax=Tanacetum coccineum TaxID=301880 RepID=A0ABQ5J6L4_9ASTR